MSALATTRRWLPAGLGAVVLSLVACAGGNWLLQDSEPTLRLVFYSDVHARTEWDTPEALALATQAINATQPDLVVATGDLITDGFQSSAATVASRWDEYVKMHEGIEADMYPVLGNHDLVAALPEEAGSRARNRACRSFAACPPPGSGRHPF